MKSLKKLRRLRKKVTKVKDENGISMEIANNRDELLNILNSRLPVGKDYVLNEIDKVQGTSIIVPMELEKMIDENEKGSDDLYFKSSFTIYNSLEEKYHYIETFMNVEDATNQYKNLFTDLGTKSYKKTMDNFLKNNTII